MYGLGCSRPYDRDHDPEQVYVKLEKDGSWNGIQSQGILGLNHRNQEKASEKWMLADAWYGKTTSWPKHRSKRHSLAWDCLYPKESKYLDSKYLAQTILTISYIEIQSPHYIGT